MNKKKWHRINFKIKWDRKTPAKFFIDLIIIDLLINPTVKEFKSKLNFWTFHRSADPKDEDGHMLKFNFYTIQETADEMLDCIKSNEDYSRIKNYFEEAEVKLRDIGTEIEAISGGIEASSEILKSWPHYITGVCEMFLGLIEETKNKKPNEKNKENPEQLENYYREINEDIADQFREGGQHAFFHHLWAIFGYVRPIELNLIVKKTTDRGEFLNINIPNIFRI